MRIDEGVFVNIWNVNIRIEWTLTFFKNQSRTCTRWVCYGHNSISSPSLLIAGFIMFTCRNTHVQVILYSPSEQQGPFASSSENLRKFWGKIWSMTYCQQFCYLTLRKLMVWLEAFGYLDSSGTRSRGLGSTIPRKNWFDWKTRRWRSIKSPEN